MLRQEDLLQTAVRMLDTSDDKPLLFLVHQRAVAAVDLRRSAAAVAELQRDRDRPHGAVGSDVVVVGVPARTMLRVYWPLVSR